MSENNAIKLPEVIAFAGPNGSGKTTITRMAKTVGEYINADDFKKRKDICFRWTNEYWGEKDIETLTGICDFAKD